MRIFLRSLRKELHGWWGTRKWLAQTAIWLVLVTDIIFVILYGPGMARNTDFKTSATLFALLLGIFTSIGVVFTEKWGMIMGWVKRPVGLAGQPREASRLALLARVLADALGFLVTMILIQGTVVYLLFLGRGVVIPPTVFLTVLGLLFLNLLWYQTLTTMLDTLWKGHWVALWIALIVLLLQAVIVFFDLDTGLINPGALPFSAAALLEIALDGGKTQAGQGVFPQLNLSVIVSLITIPIFIIVSYFSAGGGRKTPKRPSYFG